MTSTQLQTLLQDLYRDKVALRDRHVEGARHVSSYEFNNTYQYVINREDLHLSWVRNALADEGIAEPAAPAAIDVPGGKGDARQQAIAADDAQRLQAFIAAWTPRAEAMTQARHRKMLSLMLGEMREQQRFFEQVTAGRDDLLGRRHRNTGTGGGVMPVRWLE
ncbi:MAG: hypothetical protein JNM38_20245 [Acidobacteria bacterium]|nr:hypothetical protein [Acidobacteriota bacterium]